MTIEANCSQAAILTYRQLAFLLHIFMFYDFHFFFLVGAEQKEEEFVFFDIFERPIPSLLRGYSAPIRLESDLSDSDLFFLLAHDSNEFNRFVLLEA